MSVRGMRGMIMASAGATTLTIAAPPRALRRGQEMQQRVREAAEAEGPEAVAMLARVHAAADGGGAPNASAQLSRIEAAVDSMRADSDKRLKKVEDEANDRYEVLEAAINEHSTKLAAMGMGGGGGGGLPTEPEYSKPFASYVRRGATDAEESLKAANAVGDRATIHAAMSVGDQSNGGYLAPVEWDRQIQAALRPLSPLRRLAKVVTTIRSAYSTLVTDEAVGTGWVGETASRPTTSTPTFTPLVIPAGEIYAQPAVTQRMLDDSAINIEEYLGGLLSDEFARQEAIAFVSGDGSNKPMGFLRNVVGGTAENAHPAGALGQTLSGHASQINNADTFVDLKYGLGAPYRQNAVWLMNSQTAAVIAKMKDGQGNFIWRESLLASEPSTLLGRPVEIDENMPNIGAGAFPIAFGDFSRGYVINDRYGVRILRDPYSNKPFVSFYATRRVGGAVLDPKAIRVMKVAAS